MLILLASTLPLAGAFGVWMYDARPESARDGHARDGGPAPCWSAQLLPSVLAAGGLSGPGRDGAGHRLAFEVEPLGMIFAASHPSSGRQSLYSIGYMRGNHEKNQTRFYVCFAVAIWAPWASPSRATW
jgi:multicomponent Na+:H+ antiporter subunit D